MFDFGTVVLVRGQLAEPCQDGFWCDDLTAGAAFGRRQELALQGQVATLVRREGKPGRAGRVPEQLFADVNFGQGVVELPLHALVDRAGDHGDEKLEGQRKHWRPPNCHEIAVD